MVRIAHELERHPRGRSAAFDLAVGRRTTAGERLGRRHTDAGAVRTEDAIGVAVCAAAELLHVPLIVCFTASGFTARVVSSYRPPVPILAVTPEPETYRQLALVWGVVPVLVDHAPTYEAMLPMARERLLDLHLAQPGERVVFTAGVPFDQPGTTNLLKIETL
jgi:pyruvate kinase